VVDLAIVATRGQASGPALSFSGRFKALNLLEGPLAGKIIGCQVTNILGMQVVEAI